MVQSSGPSLQNAWHTALRSRLGQSLILELWLINWNIWDYRNNQKHTEDTPEAQALLLNLQDQVRQEFQSGHTDLLPAHKQLLTTVSLVFRHHRTIPSLQEWLTRIQTAHTLAITIATKKASQAQQAAQATHDLLEPSRKFFRDYLQSGKAEVPPNFGRHRNPDGTLLTYDESNEDSTSSSSSTLIPIPTHTLDGRQ